MRPAIRKMGTLDIEMMEANPVLFKGRYYLMQYIHHFYYGNISGRSYYRCVDMDDGAITPPFGHGYTMGNLYVWQDRAYLTCVESPAEVGVPDNTRFLLMESDDLIHWSEPRVILEDPSWHGFNTSICRREDDFLMVFELGKPEELVGIPFTMFFASSPDLRNWTVIEGACFGREFYTGAPMLRWYDGWAYFFFVIRIEEKGGRYETHVARSRDLRDWEWSPHNPVFTPDDADRHLAPEVTMCSKAYRKHIVEGVNINNSDIDMIDRHGKLFINYSWGNQNYMDNLAYAVFDGTEKEFCEGWFK